MKLIDYSLPDAHEKGKTIRQSWYSTKETCELFRASNVNRLLDLVVNSGLFAHFGEKLRTQAEANKKEMLFYAAYWLHLDQEAHKIVLMCKATEPKNVVRYQWYLLQPDEAWAQIIFNIGGMGLIRELEMDAYDWINPETGEVTVKYKQYRMS